MGVCFTQIKLDIKCYTFRSPRRGKAALRKVKCEVKQDLSKNANFAFSGGGGGGGRHEDERVKWHFENLKS